MEIYPSEIRERILEDHRMLRTLLERMEVLARHMLQGKGSSRGELRAQLLVLDERLRTHMELEEEVLVPALRSADAWGQERVDRFHAEHTRQREILDAIWRSDAEVHRTGIEFALLAWGLVRLLREDMAEEERLSLNERVLRDDPIEVALEPE
jgi:iron-sulfur cluster repair protein YtfE (RIC family)